jgi:phage host-nuclease inhibitor protein Gam
MSDTAAWLIRLAQQFEDQHAPQHLTIGLREAANRLSNHRTETLEYLGQVGQLSDELERVRVETLGEAAEVADSYEPRCDTCPRGVAAAIRALKGRP